MNTIVAQVVNTVTSPETVTCLLAALAGAGAAFGLNLLFRVDQRTKDGRRKRISRP